MTGVCNFCLSDCRRCVCLKLKVLYSRLAFFMWKKDALLAPAVPVLQLSRRCMSWVLRVIAMSVSYGGRADGFFSLLLPFLPTSSAFGREALYKLVFYTSANFCPKPEARNTIYFGCEPDEDDVLSKAALDSEELVGKLCDSLPPTGQDLELLDIVTSTVDKLELDIESARTQAQSKLDDCFLAGHSSHLPIPYQFPINPCLSSKTFTRRF